MAEISEKSAVNANVGMHTINADRRDPHHCCSYALSNICIRRAEGLNEGKESGKIDQEAGERRHGERKNANVKQKEAI